MRNPNDLPDPATAPGPWSVVRAATAGFQPNRLVIATLLALLLAALGGVADRIHLARGGPSFGPAGLVAGVRGESPARSASILAARVASTFASGTEAGREIGTDADHAALRTLVDRAYRERRAAFVANAADESALAGLAERYREARIRIEDARPVGPCEALARAEVGAVRSLVTALLEGRLSEALSAVRVGVYLAPSAAFATAPWTVGMALAAWIAVASVLGGGLSFATALEAGRGVRIGARATVAAATARFGSLVLAPFLPALGAALCLLPVAALAVGFRLPVADVAVGALYGIALFLGFLAAFLLLVGAIVLPLMPASIACGDADAADAFVRNAAYLLRAPFLVLACAATAILAVALGAAVAGAFAFVTLNLTATVAGWAGGAEIAAALGAVSIGDHPPPAPPPSGPTAAAAVALADLWESLLAATLAGAVLSVLFDAAARAYLVLRFRCDGQDPATLAGVPLDAADRLGGDG